MIRQKPNISYWYLGLMVLTLWSCNKDRRTEIMTLTHFVDFQIQPGLNTFDTHFYVITPLASQYQTRLAASGFTEDDVIAVEARQAFLGSIFQDVDLDYIHRISVQIFDPFNQSDRIEFFYMDPVPFKNKTSIQLFPGIADLREWIERDFFGIEIRLEFREVTPTLAQMRLEFDMRVLRD